MELLERVVAMVAEAGFGVVNVDVTVVCEAPRLADHLEEMRRRLAGALDVGIRAVSVKATTNERMGWIGRGEGVAGMAVAVIAEA